MLQVRSQDVEASGQREKKYLTQPDSVKKEGLKGTKEPEMKEGGCERKEGVLTTVTRTLSTRRGLPDRGVVLDSQKQQYIGCACKLFCI